MQRLLAGFAAVGFLWLIAGRVPAMRHLVDSSAPYFTRVADRIEVAGNHVTRLDMLPGRVAVICEFLNDRGITEYFVDDSVYLGSGPAKHRMMEGCWPKRQNAHAADGFIDESKQGAFANCEHNLLASGVIHVTCGR